MVGMEDGVFPSSRSIFDETELEEERRLCYVGMTRAREKLFMTNTFTRTLFGNTTYNKASRFLKEIPEECLENFGRNQGGGRQGQMTWNGMNQSGFSQNSFNQNGMSQNANGYSVEEYLSKFGITSPVKPAYGSGASQYKPATGMTGTGNTGQNGGAGSPARPGGTVLNGSAGNGFGAGQAKPAGSTIGFGRVIHSAADVSRVTSGAGGPGFKEGDRVSHKKFGEGKILSVEKENGDYKIEIQFKNHGMKRLMAAFANLTKLGDE
jgi:DNA helicase-2/ATP-dependent DNA helicase PcrA